MYLCIHVFVYIKYNCFMMQAQTIIILSFRCNFWSFVDKQDVSLCKIFMFLNKIVDNKLIVA